MVTRGMYSIQSLPTSHPAGKSHNWDDLRIKIPQTTGRTFLWQWDSTRNALVASGGSPYTKTFIKGTLSNCGMLTADYVGGQDPAWCESMFANIIVETYYATGIHFSVREPYARALLEQSEDFKVGYVLPPSHGGYDLYHMVYAPKFSTNKYEDVKPLKKVAESPKEVPITATAKTHATAGDHRCHTCGRVFATRGAHTAHSLYYCKGKVGVRR